MEQQVPGALEHPLGGAAGSWCTLWVEEQIPWCPGAPFGWKSRSPGALELTVLSLCAGGADPRGAGPPLIAQRGVLPDHGPPRAAAGAGLCIHVRVQILLRYPGRSGLGSTSGSLA